MIPYRGRLALRIARIVLAWGSLAWRLTTELDRGPFHLDWVLALFAAYAVFSAAELSGVNVEKAWRTLLAIAADMGNFALLNRIYAEAFADHKPARSTVQAAALPKGARVEIDLVARIPG